MSANSPQHPGSQFNLSGMLGSSQHSQLSQVNTLPNPACHNRSSASAAAGSAKQAAQQGASTEEEIIQAVQHPPDQNDDA